MRQQFVDATSWVSWQAFVHVLEVSVRIVAVEFRGLDQAHDDSCAATGAQRAGK